MGNCDFEKGSRNLHFHSYLLVGREGVTKQSTLCMLRNVDKSGRPLSWCCISLRTVCVADILVNPHTIVKRWAHRDLYAVVWLMLYIECYPSDTATRC